MLSVFIERFIKRFVKRDISFVKQLDLSQVFNSKYDELVTGRLMFGDYIVPGAEPKSYEQVSDFDKLVKTMEEYLDDYNAATTKKMNLVM